MRHPRPLADSERGVIREAFAPVLRDLRATGAIMPDVREVARDDRAGEAVSAWVTSGDGSGIAVWRCPRSQRVAGAIGGL